MGVNKLWDILLTIAVKKNIEDLSGLILAIDASLWIVKVNSIFQNQDEGLKSIFNKIIWLRKNNIKPIFVFDGSSPALKRKTIQERRHKRREMNDLDIAKKVQIEIVKKITGVASQTQKVAIQTSYEQKQKQIDIMFNNLMKYSQSSDVIDLSEKISLQAEVLNKKYQLFCETIPHLEQKYGVLEQFSNLDIESKEQILQTIAQQDMPSGKDVRALRDKMSEQQKIFYEMQLITKKSKIRQLQDNLYRKVLTKKVQDGYEIIEGVYNGKKVIQKRKVKPKSYNEWNFGKGKNSQCNDFREIFLNKRQNQQEDQNSHEEQSEEKGDFFSNIFAKDYTTQKRDSSGSFQQVSQRLSETHNTKKQQSRRYAEMNKASSPKIYQNKRQSAQKQQEFESYQNLFDVQPKPERPSISSQNSQDNPDHFPDFIMMQSLDEVHNSSSNAQLQNILEILGVNYIVAPFQAEAQCAVLEQLGLVDGVVTEDSDAFLFGARKVYRGLYQDNIKLYSMSRVQQKLLLTRQKMILFALMLGSDYTDGIKGIGIVNAMQILKIHHTIQSLNRFTNWARSADVLSNNQTQKTDYMVENAACEDEKQFYLLHKKYKNYWYVHPNFPQQNIYDAYCQPDVLVGDQIEDRVKSNKKIYEDGVLKLMQDKFHMSQTQIDWNMKILTKKFERKLQMQITDFGGQALAKIASKRLQKAIEITGARFE